MDERYAALAEGKKTYTTGKPCTKGHLSERYSSNGACLACLRDKRQTYLQATARRNLLNSRKFHSEQISVQLQHKHIINDINDIMLECGHRAELLAQFIMLISRSTLKRDDLCRLLKVNEQGHVINHKDHRQRHNDAGKLEIEIMGEWYVADDVMDCIRGKVKEVHRVVEDWKAGLAHGV